jgi:hypothetical protein
MGVTASTLAMATIRHLLACPVMGARLGSEKMVFGVLVIN